MLRILISPECPGCERKSLRRTPLGGLHCQSCGVVVDTSRHGWRYPLESVLRPLPGIAGIGWRGDAA